MTVERVRVADVLRLVRRPVTPEPNDVYTSIGIRSFGKGIFTYEPKPGNELGSLRYFDVEPGRLLLSNIKGWEGAIAVSGDEHHGCVASNRFLPYEPVDDRIDVDWAKWFFLSELGLGLIGQASPGSADRNRTLAIDRFEALWIPLPPIDEQRQVAARLNRVATLSNSVRDLVKRGDALVESFKVASAGLPRLGDPERINLGWRRVRLSDVMALAQDIVPVDPAESYPNVGILSFGRGVFGKPPIDGASTSAKSLHRIRAGQFIYSRLFAFEGAYTYVPEHFDGRFVSQEFPTFDADPKQLDARWLASFLRSPDRWSELSVSSKGLGVRRQRIQPDAVLRHQVWLPPLEEQLRMVKRIEELEVVAARRGQVGTLVDAVLPAQMNRAFAISC
jgi:type I restriction enzyme S subunit